MSGGLWLVDGATTTTFLTFDSFDFTNNCKCLSFGVMGWVRGVHRKRKKKESSFSCVMSYEDSLKLNFFSAVLQSVFPNQHTQTNVYALTCKLLISVTHRLVSGKVSWIIS